jgi:hypothetical protein
VAAAGTGFSLLAALDSLALEQPAAYARKGVRKRLYRFDSLTEMA